MALAMERRVSAIIPVFNSARTLDLCLEALGRSSVRPQECIVVADGCSDDSASVAEKYGAEVIRTGLRSGPTRARNLGVAHANGDLILFLDSDVCVHSDTLARILTHFDQDPGLDAVIGAYDDSPAAGAFISQYRNLLHCFTHRMGRSRASTFWCGCGAVRRDVFLGSGGFDERFERPSVEDIEFGARLTTEGHRILLDPQIQVQHLKRWTFLSMLRTDIFDRGIPWTRLILRNRSMPNDLNVRLSQRASLGVLALLVAMICLRYSAAALGCGLVFLALNAEFYRFLAVRRGVLFALRALPLHVLFFLASGVAFFLGTAAHIISWDSFPRRAG
jgi:glycosyltransferase involved in cell wall biosynthesis